MSDRERGSYDAVVIGGGPAGATAATLIAQGGRRVVLLERSPEPAFKVGESLMPATYWTLSRLGALPRMRETLFPRKYSVQFWNADGRPSRPFYFFETDDHESSQTWQVLRSDFDALLLDNARDHGVEVRMGTAVQEVLFAGERAVGVRLADGGDGPGEELAARVVVDASGQSGLLSRQLGLRQVDPELRHAAYWTHYQGARRDSGLDEGATLVLHTVDRRAWFWFIPLPEDRASVGVVGPLDHLVQGRPGDPEAVFGEELARCPALRERLAGTQRLFPVRVARDFSYKCRQMAGAGWVLAGDAFGFLDPIYSSGVFLALKSGEMAADAVLAALAAGDPSEARLRRFEGEFVAGMEAMKQLVYAFYDPTFSFGRFLDRHPHLRSAIVDLLVGNVYRKPATELFDTLRSYREELRLEGAATGSKD